jgi:hypothetical protein
MYQIDYEITEKPIDKTLKRLQFDTVRHVSETMLNATGAKRRRVSKISKEEMTERFSRIAEASYTR